MKKLIAWLLVFSFLHSQVLPAGFAASEVLQLPSIDGPVKTADQAAEEKQPVPENVHQTAMDFLQDDSALSAAGDHEEEEEIEEEKTREEEKEETPAAAGQGAPGSFETALDYLRNAKNFAVTTLKKITKENLLTLASQAWEFGLAVVQGVVVLFTSHEKQALSVPAAFARLIEAGVDLMSHFHVRIGETQALLEPSLKDIQEAGEKTEYVSGLTEEGELAVRAYSSMGAEPMVYDAEYLISKIEAAQRSDADFEAVSKLMMAEEITGAENLEYIRATGTYLPGFPVLTNFASQNPQGAISVSQANSSLFQMDYNVTNGSFVGTTINFGASVNGPQNLSAYAGFSFDMRRGDNNCLGNGIVCVLVEFKDTSGNFAKIAIYNLATSWQQIDIPKSALLSLNPFLNFGAIKEINFIQDGNTIGFGALQVGSNGLSFTPVLTPDASGAGITKLPATSTGERPALTAFSSQDGSSTNVQVFSATSARINYTGVSNSSFGGAFLNYDNAGTGAVETINFNSLYSSGLVIEMNDNGTPTDTLTFELTDSGNKKETVLLHQIAGSSNRWKILPGHFAEIDVTKIKTIAIVFKGLGNQGQTSGSLNLNWGDFLFTPTVNPDSSNPIVPGLPSTSQGVRPEFIGFASSDGSSSSVTQLSSTLGRFRYTGSSNNSYGGAFINYDDPNTGAKESINLNTVFPSGMYFQLDNNGTGQGSVAFEVTDANGKRDTVNLGSITSSSQRYRVLASLFDEVDVTKIVSFAFVYTGAGTKDLSVNWGYFYYVPTISPASGNPATTVLPVTSTGLRPELVGFAKADGSSAGVSMFSQTFGRIRYIGNNSTSYGGAFINYDNADTPAKEAINLSALFSTGIVFSVDNNGSGLSSITFEATDNTGKKDTVTLGSIQNFGQKYRILPSAFDEIDVTKIVSLAFVFKGASSGADLSVDWGNFDYFPQIPPDGSNPAITPAPATSTGARPVLTGFASQDGSAGTAQTFSTTFGRVHYVGASAISYGGAFLDYDDPSTGAKETISLSSLFPSGLVFQLDNNGSAFQAITFEVTDNLGRKDTVQLTQIANFGKKYRIQISLFDEVDVTKIVSMAFVFKGATAAAGLDLNVDWGNFFFTPTIGPDGSNPAITALPLNSLGARPALTGFAKTDGSSSNVTMSSVTFGRFRYTGSSATSFGGAFIDYDDPATGAKETINLSSLYPAGMVMQLDNNGTGAASVTLEVTDINGKKDTVTLGSLKNFGQKYKILPAAFDEVDVTRILSIAFVYTGSGTKDLSVDWGNFAFTPTINPDGTNPAITKLPVNGSGLRPALTGFAKQDGSTGSVSMFSTTFARVTYNGAASDSFGGAFATYDNPATVGTVESINLSSLFSGGLVIQVDNNSTALGSITLEVTDANGKKDSVLLGGLENFGQKYKILPAAFDEVDVTKIATFAFVFKGAGTRQLSVDWGNFAFVPDLPADAANPAVTPLPVTGTGERPAFTAFASLDGSDVTAPTTSAATGQINFTNLVAATSFGGAFISYDNFGTPGTIETINLSSVFSGGMVFGLHNNNTGMTSVELEVTDINGKKDKIRLTGITSSEKHWKVMPSIFDEVDLTKIQSIAFVATGGVSGKSLTVNWGNFAYIPTVNSDASNPAVTQLPANGLGAYPILTGFARELLPSGQPDFSGASVTLTSPTQARIDLDVFGETSYAGAFVSYDNPATLGTLESININSLFSGGLVLGLDNGGTALSQVYLEVTDSTGKKDKVLLNGLTASQKRWKVFPSAFDEVNTSQITAIALVVENGPKIDQVLNVNWGHFGFTPGIASDPANPALTPAPVNGLGTRPEFTGFASQDFSSGAVTMSSSTVARIDLNLFNTSSFGGAFISYDNPATTGTLESINFNSAFPSGLVLGLDNGGTNLTSLTLELTDASGRREKVTLTGIAATQKRWKILASNFEEINMGAITSIALVAEGRQSGKVLNVSWGNFSFTPKLTSDPFFPAVTPAPVDSLGNRPVFTGFASEDFSSASAAASSVSQARADMVLFNTGSFGGAFLNYDNPATTNQTESIDFTSAFPSGIVLGLDDAGTGLSTLALELTDAAGKKEKVVLSGITSSQKRWKILVNHFEEINLSVIKSIALVAEGRIGAKSFNVTWGNFAFTPSVASDPSNPAITKLPSTSTGARPQPFEFVSQDFSSADLNVTSLTEAGLDLRLFNTGSFGGLFISYDNAATTNTTETINLNSVFPSGLVLALNNGGSSLAELEFEVTDSLNRKDVVKITGITSSFKRWKIPASLFDGVDVTQIKTLSLVVKGRMPSGIVNVSWGDFAYVPQISSDPSNPAITRLPVTSTGRAPVLNGFASAVNSSGGPDYSDVDVSVTSSTAARVDFNLYNGSSFGGAALSYDNPATTNVKESINLNSLFGGGMVLELNNGGSAINSVVIEITDADGKKDSVELVNITSLAKKWKILPGSFDEIDTTRVVSIAFVVNGRVINGILNINWGLFDYFPEI